MKSINWLIVSLVASFLTGCAVTKTPEGTSIGMLPVMATSKQERYLDLDARETPKSEKMKKYINQLLEIYPNQEYTLIRTFPYPVYQTYDSFTPRPYMIYSIDGNRVKVAENAMFSSTTVLLTEYAQTDIKVPVGTHDLVIINGYKNSNDYTELKNVVFEVGKKYVIGSDYSKEMGSRLYIAEYEADNHFRENQPEHIVIKKKVIQDIKQGNLKSVKIY